MTLKRIFRILYLFSLCLLCFWIITFIAGQFLQYDFTNSNVKEWFELIRSIGIPITVIIVFGGTIRKSDDGYTIFLKVLATVIIFISVGILLTGLSLSGMCTWTTTKAVYKNKFNSDKIIEREFGCGATDSGPPTSKLFMEKNPFPYLVSYSAIDSTTIVTSEWELIQYKFHSH